MIAIDIERAAAVLAGASLKSFLIVAVAGLVVATWRKSSAAARHFVWTAAIGATIVLPLLGVLMPQWSSRAISMRFLEPTVATTRALDGRPQPSTLDRSTSTIDEQVATLPTIASASDIAASTVASPRVNEEPIAPIANPPALSMAANALDGLREIGWAKAALAIWLAGFVGALLPFCFGRLRLRRIASSARVVTNGRWAGILERVRASGGITRPVILLETRDAAMPMTWGILSPVLLLPAGTEGWPEWKCRNILFHELAHIERRDCLTQVIAQLACAVYWFNPLVWTAAHRMRVERELACDDRVIGAGSRPAEYAGHLLDVARSLRPARATAHAAIAMARPSQLAGRLTAVLDRERNRERVSPRFRAAVGAATLGVLLPVASFSPWVAEASASPNAAGTRASSSSRYAASTEGSGASASARALKMAVQLPPVAITGNLAGGIMPIIKAVQSSDAALGLPLAPAPASTPAHAVVRAATCWQSKQEGSINFSINDNDSRNTRTIVRFSRDDCTLELRADGRFTLRPDLSDVATLERGSLFTIEERDGRETRRMEIRSGADGLEHVYYVNGRRADYSPEARAWLANTLLAVERRTAFAAETRVPQIFEGRGAKGVLDEVTLMPADYAKSRYLTVLLKQGINFDAPTLTRIVQQSAREMNSDYYLAEVFKQVGTQPLADENTWRAFADAAVGMKSDYYKAQVISKVLSRERLDASTVATLLKAASTIDSDYYQAETLKSMSKRYAVTPQSRPYYLAALGRIKSDYYKAEVLSALNNGDALDATTTSAILKSVGDMSSDYYKSEALATLAKRGRLDASTRGDYFAAIRSIDSDYYKHQALNESLRERPLTRETVAGILSVAPAIKSDYELSALLSELARLYPIDDSLRPAYDRAVDSIQSDYYRGAALAAARRASTR
jgi:beta-lactamase regulating signal transducer with metallopeptidase domain